jgi:hypothetical protein
MELSNNKLLFIIIAIIIVIHIIYKCCENKEGFYGLTYSQENDYLKCCQKFGCNSLNCQYFLKEYQSPLYQIGAIHSLDPESEGIIFGLYRRYNADRQDFEYLFKNQMDYNNTYYVLLDVMHPIFDGDVIKNPEDGKDYAVSLQSSDGVAINNYQYYNNLVSFPRYMIFNPEYSNRVIYPTLKKVGVLRPTIDNPQLPQRLVLLETDINVWRRDFRYYTNIFGTMVELRNTKKIEDGDSVDIPQLGTKYIFQEMYGIF